MWCHSDQILDKVCVLLVFFEGSVGNTEEEFLLCLFRCGDSILEGSAQHLDQVLDQVDHLLVGRQDCIQQLQKSQQSSWCGDQLIQILVGTPLQEILECILQQVGVVSIKLTSVFEASVDGQCEDLTSILNSAGS